MIAYLKRLFGSSNDDDVIGGSDAVFSAILEFTDEDAEYVIYLGEPELIDRGREFKTEYMVRVPTETQSGDPQVADLEYPLPSDYETMEDNEFTKLLDRFDIPEVSALGELQGETVFGTVENGTLVPSFD
jgi:hypothetical protein